MVKRLRSRAPEDPQEVADSSVLLEEEKAGTSQEDADDSLEPSDAPIGTLYRIIMSIFPCLPCGPVFGATILQLVCPDTCGVMPAPTEQAFKRVQG